jgi:hypothetical protein
MKQKFYIAVLSIMLATISLSSSATDPGDDRPKKEVMTDDQKRARLEQLKNRVVEIKGLDKSTLNKAERKALKKELRDMRKESKKIEGVYLSVGAIIIIILLLILIL